jgi:hypothetical protein
MGGHQILHTRTLPLLSIGQNSPAFFRIPGVFSIAPLSPAQANRSHLAINGWRGENGMIDRGA